VKAVVGMLACITVAAGRPPARAFRVCADPNNLPNSNRAGQGYDNKIASLVAHDLGEPVEYTWYPALRGFVRKTLNTGACDVIMGVPAHYDPVLTTAPYFRTVYALVYRADRGYHITSLDDPALASLRIGVHMIGDDYQNTPGAAALAARGIVDRVVGFPIIGDYGRPSPQAELIDAVARKRIDVAIAWGPLAGYFASRERVPLVVVPLPDRPDSSGAVFGFDIAVGVRKRDTALAAAIDSVLTRERPAIRRILHDYGVPVIEDGGREKQ
jgi:mxaJ protein